MDQPTDARLKRANWGHYHRPPSVGGLVPAGESALTTRNHDNASSSSSLKCPGTMATGIGNAPAVLPILLASGLGPSMSVPAASTRDGDVFVLVDEVEDLLGLVAVADHPLGRDPGGTIGAARKTVEHRVRGLVSLGLVGDPEPLLVTVVRLDHQQHDHARVGVGRPA